MDIRARNGRRTGFRATSVEGGFSIIELIVSLTIFSLLVGTLVALIATGLRAARNNRDRSVGAHLASQEMDATRQLAFARMRLGSSRHPVTVNGVSYQVRTDTEWVANSSTSNACDSAGSSPRAAEVHRSRGLGVGDRGVERDPEPVVLITVSRSITVATAPSRNAFYTTRVRRHDRGRTF